MMKYTLSFKSKANNYIPYTYYQFFDSEIVRKFSGRVRFTFILISPDAIERENKNEDEKHRCEYFRFDFCPVNSFEWDIEMILLIQKNNYFFQL